MPDTAGSAGQDRIPTTAAGRTLPDEEPCKCHRSHAYVAPFHPGHCCFWPPTRTCHPDEVAEWERQSNLRRDMRSTPSSVVNHVP